MSPTFQMAVAARRWYRTYEFTSEHSLYAGQALFALGWSLVWAISLAIVPFVPISVGLMLMAAGLALPVAQRWRRSGRQLTSAPTLRGQ